jgi:hypothetical protein
MKQYVTFEKEEFELVLKSIRHYSIGLSHEIKYIRDCKNGERPAFHLDEKSIIYVSRNLDEKFKGLMECMERFNSNIDFKFKNEPQTREVITEK